MRLRYYTTPRGDRPIATYIEGLSRAEQAGMAAALTEIAERGFEARDVTFRQIGGKLWEVRIGPHRVFRVLKNPFPPGCSKRFRCKAARVARCEAYFVRTSQRRASAPTPQMGLFQQPIKCCSTPTGNRPRKRRCGSLSSGGAGWRRYCHEAKTSGREG